MTWGWVNDDRILILSPIFLQDPVASIVSLYALSFIIKLILVVLAQ